VLPSVDCLGRVPQLAGLKARL